MIRRLIAATLLFSGAAIANAGFVAWWFDREVTDPERVREMAAAVLRSPEIRAELAPMLLDQATAELQLADTDIAALTDAAETTLLDPAYIRNYADTLEGIYRSIFETGEPAGIGRSHCHRTELCGDEGRLCRRTFRRGRHRLRHRHREGR